jgi:site-specific recombinase XerD
MSKTTGFLQDHRPLVRLDRGSVEHAYRKLLMDRESMGVSPRTIQFYECKLKRFRAYLEGKGITQVAQVDGDHFREYAEIERARGTSPANLHCITRCIHAWFNFLANEDMVDPRLVRKIKLPKVPKKLIQPFSLDQLEALLRAAKRAFMPERDTAILYLLIDTGIRAGELCSITVDDVANDRILINGKGAKQRWVPISPRTKRAIWHWSDSRRECEEPWLFITRAGRKMEPNTVYQMMERLGAQASITGVRCSPHTIRHTTAIEFIRSGAAPFELRKLLGHETLHMTNRYVAIADEDVAKAHKVHSLAEKLSKRRG